MRIIPVLSLEPDVPQDEIVKYAAEQHLNGCAFRIMGHPNDWENPQDIIDSALNYLKLSYKQCSLIIDIGSMYKAKVTPVREALVLKLPILITGKPWRDVTLVSGAFPKPNPKDNDIFITRSDIQLWRQINKTYPGFYFGDYGVDNPSFGIKLPRKSSTILKYTLANQWWFMREPNIPGPETGKLDAKNKPIRGPGRLGDFRILCRKLIANPLFMKPGYSWGDKSLYERATAANGGQSPERRKAMFSHHFTVVLNELNGLAKPVAGPVPPTTPADVELPS